MSFDEIAIILKAKEGHRREAWEQLRKQCYYSSMSGLTEKEFGNKYFKLPWDVKEEKKVSKLTKEEREKRAKLIEKKLNKNK